MINWQPIETYPHDCPCGSAKCLDPVTGSGTPKLLAYWTDNRNWWVTIGYKDSGYWLNPNHKGSLVGVGKPSYWAEVNIPDTPAKFKFEN